jgi:hypothetical protein
VHYEFICECTVSCCYCRCVYSPNIGDRGYALVTWQLCSQRPVSGVEINITWYLDSVFKLLGEPFQMNYWLNPTTLPQKAPQYSVLIPMFLLSATAKKNILTSHEVSTNSRYLSIKNTIAVLHITILYGPTRSSKKENRRCVQELQKSKVSNSFFRSLAFLETSFFYNTVAYESVNML